MAKTAPVVYLLHGEETWGMGQFLGTLKKKLGDETTAEMNTTVMEGERLSLEALEAAASAAPFLAARRIVVVEEASRKLKGKEQQERLTQLMERLPESTALVLMEKKELGKGHWLLKWAQAAGGRAFVRAYPSLKGGAMANWIRKQTAEQGGEMHPSAAHRLAEMVGEDARAASHEIEKLLAYVNYQRAIEVDDVENLAAFASGRGDFFALIDALGSGEGRKAMEMLHLLLDEQEPLSLFFGLVNHFRLLLQTREVLENGGTADAAAEQLGIHPYRAKKLFGQARQLDLATLENIYRRLLSLDKEIKTGQKEATLALDTLVATLSGERV